MPSPTDIINNAIVDLNIASTVEAVKPNDFLLGFNHYNRIVNRLALLPKMGWYMRNESFPFAASQQSYTIGPSGSADFAITGPRPPLFDAAKLVLTSSTPSNEIQIPIITVQIYESVPIPELTSGQPWMIYYQPTVPDGTLFPIAVPTNTANELRLFWRVQLVEVSIDDVGTSIDLPPAYEDMLTSMLMVRLASIPAYGITLTADMRLMASEAYSLVAGQNNSDPKLIGTDLLGRNYGQRVSGTGTYFRTLGGVG